MKYIIDFERINELTAHPSDSTNNNGYGGQSNLCYSITKKCIKFYIDTYLEYDAANSRSRLGLSESRYLEAIDVLHWNKILISISDIRDDKIDKIVN